MITVFSLNGSSFQNKSINSQGKPVTAEESILTKEGVIKSYDELNASQKEALDTFVRQQVQSGTPFGRKLVSFFLEPHLDKFLRKLALPSRFQALPYNIKMAVYRNPKALQKPELSASDEVFSHIQHGNAAIPLKINGQLTLNSALRNNHPFIFHRALQSLKYEATKEELDCIDKKDGLGVTAFYTAVATQHIPEAMALLHKGANPFIVNPEGQSAIGVLAKFGETATLEKMLRATDKKHLKEHESDIEGLKREAETNKARIDEFVKDYKHQNLSKKARQALLWEMVRSGSDNPDEDRINALRALALLRLGSKVDDVDADGTSLIDWASQYGQAEMTSALIHSGANVNHGAQSKSGWTPLDSAFLFGHGAETAKILIHAGANINHEINNDPEHPTAPYNRKISMLETAISDEDTNLFPLFINAGIDLQDAVRRHGGELLITAAFGGRNDIISKLIEAGADVNYDSKFRNTTPLQTAIEEEHEDTVELLKAHGATKLNPSFQPPISPREIIRIEPDRWSDFSDSD